MRLGRHYLYKSYKSNHDVNSTTRVTLLMITYDEK